MSLTAIPYNRVQTTRNILFATRAGKIHSFNLSDGNHLSTWQHPDVGKFANASNQNDSSPRKETAAVMATSEVGAETSEPQAKRQKTAQSEDANATASDNADHDKTEDVCDKTIVHQGKRKGKKQSKGPSHGDNSRMGRVVDRPIITLMTCTNDGSHLIAVSGHDKAVWVFEHNGQGTLTQLSQR